jgi:hypothetical protein
VHEDRVALSSIQAPEVVSLEGPNYTIRASPQSYYGLVEMASKVFYFVAAGMGTSEPAIVGVEAMSS